MQLRNHLGDGQGIVEISTMTALGLMKTVKKADGACSFVFGNLSNIQVETGLIVFGLAKWVQLDMTDQLAINGE